MRSFEYIDYLMLRPLIDHRPNRKVTIVREDGTSLMGMVPLQELYPPERLVLSNRWFDPYYSGSING